MDRILYYGQFHDIGKTKFYKILKVRQGLDFLFQYGEAVTPVKGSENEIQKGNLKM